MARRLTPNARHLTDAQRRTLLDALKSGSTYRAACGAAGISWPTWMRWSREVRAGECADPDVEALVTDARTTYEAANVALAASINLAGVEDWKAAAWLLDHRGGDPKRRHDEKRARYEAEIARNRAEGTHVETVRHVGEMTPDELRSEARQLLADLDAADEQRTRH